MPDKPVPDNDPIVTKSYAAHYMIAVALLTASLLWALYDEAYGMRPWKAYQHESKQRYSAFLQVGALRNRMPLRKKSRRQFRLPELQARPRSGRRRQLPPPRSRSQKQIGDLSRQNPVRCNDLYRPSVPTSARSPIRSRPIHIVKRKHSEGSGQGEGARRPRVEYPDGSKQPYTFGQLEETYNSLKDERAKAECCNWETR